MCNQTIKRLICTCMVLLISSFAACSSDSQGFDGMLKVKSDACAAKAGTFDANAIYQCTCGGLPLGNMDVCFNHIAILTCDPDDMVKECVRTYDETKKTNISQWQYCRYGVWEMGEASEGDTCPVCDSTAVVTCGEKSSTDATIGVTRCIGGVWDFTACASGCNAANNGCADCTDGTKLCEGSTLRICQNGAYTEQTCTNGCADNACVVVDVCTNGTKKCGGDDGNTLLTCNNGQWDRSECTNGCIDNDCAASTTGEDSCTASVCMETSSGYKVKVCTSENVFAVELTDCGQNSCNAAGTGCGKCKNGETRCPGHPQICTNGEWVDNTSASDNGCQQHREDGPGGGGPGGGGQQP